jgi:hypothetical protein
MKATQNRVRNISGVWPSCLSCPWAAPRRCRSCASCPG